MADDTLHVSAMGADNLTLNAAQAPSRSTQISPHASSGATRPHTRWGRGSNDPPISTWDLKDKGYDSAPDITYTFCSALVEELREVSGA